MGDPHGLAQANYLEHPAHRWPGGANNGISAALTKTSYRADWRAQAS